MPSALRASRDFMAQALARVRSGVQRYERDLDRPGVEIKVEPFDAHNASTAAGLIKLGAKINQTRRAKANLQEALKDVELEREKTRAEIAKIRSEEKYNLGEGRKTETQGPARLEHGVGKYPAGTLVSEANTGLSQERLEASAASERASRRSAGKVSAAQASMKQLDAQVERDVQNRIARGMQSAEPTFRRIMAAGAANKGLDEPVTAAGKTLRDDLMDVGIDPSSWQAQNNYNRQSLITAARAALAKRYEPGYRRQVSTFFQPQREKIQSVIDQGVEGFGEEGEDGDVVDLIIDANGNLVPAPQ